MPDVADHLIYWGKTDRECPTTSWHPLACHMLDAAAVAQTFLRQSGWVGARIEAMIPGLVAWLPFLIGLHDLGKFADSFQRKVPALMRSLQPGRGKPLPCQRHHTSAGYLLWKEGVAGAVAAMGFGRGEGWDHLAAAVFGHHGAPPVDLTVGIGGASVAEAFSSEDIAAATAYVQEAIKLLAPAGCTFPIAKRGDLKRVSWLVAGLAVVCDWLASNAEWFPFNGAVTDLDAYWTKQALPQAADALMMSGLTPSAVAGEQPFSVLFPHLAEVAPSPLQVEAGRLDLGDGPWLVVIEDSPGSGKTEAAIQVVNRLMSRGMANGVYVGLPTQATANMMFSRMAATYGRLYSGEAPSIVLAHGRAAFASQFRRIVGANGRNAAATDGAAQCAEWLADSRKKALLASVGIGTIDQALLAALPSSHQSLRLFGMAGNVLVVDEVHACDRYMNRLLEAVLRFQAMLGGSAILISATLPQSQRRGLVEAFASGCTKQKPHLPFAEADFPLLTGWSPSGGLVEKPVAAAGRKEFAIARVGTFDGAVKGIVASANAGECVCWVRNTVGDAVAAYVELLKRLGPERVMLMHARFAAGDRDRIEETVVARYGHPRSATQADRRPGTVLIATQVVEQSLDLDFDVMYSDIAPIDLLIQRAGRLQRHDRGHRCPPVLHIVGPAATDKVDEDWLTGDPLTRGTSWVYRHDGQMWLTMRLLCDAGRVVLPDDARRLVEGVYGTPPISPPASLRERSDEHEGQDEADAYLAGRSVLPADHGYRRDGVWLDDQAVSTRLGEQTVTLRLLRDIGGQIMPWGDGTGIRALADGDLSVRHSQVDAADQRTLNRLEAMMTTWPDSGRWCVPVLLSEGADGVWRGAAQRCGNGIMVVADPVAGVSFVRP